LGFIEGNIGAREREYSEPPSPNRSTDGYRVDL